MVLLEACSVTRGPQGRYATLGGSRGLKLFCLREGFGFIFLQSTPEVLTKVQTLLPRPYNSQRLLQQTLRSCVQ